MRTYIVKASVSITVSPSAPADLSWAPFVLFDPENPAHGAFECGADVFITTGVQGTVVMRLGSDSYFRRFDMRVILEDASPTLAAHKDLLARAVAIVLPDLRSAAVTNLVVHEYSVEEHKPTSVERHRTDRH